MLKIKKNKISKTDSRLHHKIKEINVPFDIMDTMFGDQTPIGHETPEERQIREQKEDYNAEIMNKINLLAFTDRQREVFNLMYKEGKSMTDTAKILNLGITTIQKIKEAIFRKIKKRVRYDFRAVID
jgi:DNA-directed RNA polymerase specialized sigma subunit